MDKVTLERAQLHLFLDSAPARAAFQAAEGVIRTHSRTFYFATALLPTRARRAIRALYGFCRTTDDLADQDGATLGDVESWKVKIALPSRMQEDPVLLAWALVREKYGVNRRYEAELIEGIRWDVAARRYPDWPSLAEYCYRVASTVGLMSMPVIGLRRGVNLEEAAPYAIRLGQALQLTNILRDVGEDASRGRVYLPLTDLAAHDLTEADILNGIYDERFVELMRFEIRRARDLYADALPGISLLSPQARPAVGAAALLYRAILDEIETIHYRVHLQRAHTSSLKKLKMLPRILYTVYTL